MSDRDGNKVTFEEALNKAGFGLYSYLLVSVSGLIIISVVFVAYGNTIIIPTSACELGTTTAQRGILAAAPLIGFIFGAVIWGYLADVFGRRLTLLISLLSAATVNAVASLSINWIMLMIMQFITALLASGHYSQAMTILSESVPIAKRNVVVLLVGSLFLLAQGIMAVLAIPIIPLTFSIKLPSLGIYWNSWRTLMLIYSTPSIISAIWLYFMYESPKFLFSKGRDAEALDILKKIHHLNHLGSKEEFDVNNITVERTASVGERSIKDQFLPMFKAPLLKNTIILTMLFIVQQLSTISCHGEALKIASFQVWLPTIANQFVEILSTGDGSELTLCGILQSGIHSIPNPDAVPCSLNVTSLLIVLGVGAMQSLVNALISLVVNRVGRRNMVMCITSFCGTCGIVVNLVPNAIGSAVLFFIFLIGIVTFGLYTAITVALFPTSLRALAVSFTMSGTRIGTFASVQILNALLETNCEAGFYVYAALFASSALIAAFLEDDRKPLTIEDTRNDKIF